MKKILFGALICCMFLISDSLFMRMENFTVSAAEVNLDAPEGQEENGEFPDAEGEIAWNEKLNVLMRSRVRSAPDVTSDTVGTLMENTMVTAFGKLNDENGELWYHIRSEDPLMEGYIKASLVEETGETAGEDDEGGLEDPQEYARTVSVNVKSNYVLHGGNHLKEQTAVQTMAEAKTDTAPDKMSAENKILSSLRAATDINVIILTAFAAFAFFLLCYAYGRLAAEAAGDTVFEKKKDKKNARQKKAKRKRSAKQRGKEMSRNNLCI